MYFKIHKVHVSIVYIDCAYKISTDIINAVRNVAILTMPPYIKRKYLITGMYKFKVDVRAMTLECMFELARTNILRITIKSCTIKNT